eukprot:758371-Hanusia_phi.AAC.1
MNRRMKVAHRSISLLVELVKLSRRSCTGHHLLLPTLSTLPSPPLIPSPPPPARQPERTAQNREFRTGEPAGEEEGLQEEAQRERGDRGEKRWGVQRRRRRRRRRTSLMQLKLWTSPSFLSSVGSRTQHPLLSRPAGRSLESPPPPPPPPPPAPSPPPCRPLPSASPFLALSPSSAHCHFVPRPPARRKEVDRSPRSFSPIAFFLPLLESLGLTGGGQTRIVDPPPTSRLLPSHCEDQVLHGGSQKRGQK